MSEEMIVRHCSPTLAGMKTGNLFRCKHRSAKALKEQIAALNRRLAKKGLRILPLAVREEDALIYVYRPSRLQADLAAADAKAILAAEGYGEEAPTQCIHRLRKRLEKQASFPHEIGLFLGYPPEDVRGFIRKEQPKCGGHWQVYGNEKQAKELFAKYKKCTEVYTRCHSHGSPLERLTVTV